MRSLESCFLASLAVLCALSVTGCGTFPMRKEVSGSNECAIFQAYPGPRPAAEQLAVVRCARDDGMFVSELNGRRVAFPPWPISKDGWEEVRFEVAPGPVTLNLAASRGMGANLVFTAEAGHTYDVRTPTNPAAPFLVDAASGKPVAYRIQGAGGRAEFEDAVRGAMSEGKVSGDAVTVTYPDGSTRVIQKPAPDAGGN